MSLALSLQSGSGDGSVAPTLIFARCQCAMFRPVLYLSLSSCTRISVLRGASPAMLSQLHRRSLLQLPTILLHARNLNKTCQFKSEPPPWSAEEANCCLYPISTKSITICALPRMPPD